MIGRLASLGIRAVGGRDVLGAVFRRRRALRILCYHGVVPDELAGRPWVPSYFVTVSQFRAQMELLARLAPVMRLDKAVERLARAGDGSPEAIVAVTFDDVATCSFVHARPILHELGIPATFFVSTGPVESGRLFPADVLKLLQLQPHLVEEDVKAALKDLVREPGRYKRMSLYDYGPALARAGEQVLHRAEPKILEVLRPLSWSQVSALDSDGHEIGGHTVDHVILGAQPERLRRRQVEGCVNTLRARLGRAVAGIAYPNGGPGDFGPQDGNLLQELGLHYAASTRAGFVANNGMFDLPRTCIGLGHSLEVFALEVAGLLDRRRLRQQGWS